VNNIIIGAIGVIALYLFSGLRVLREYERGVYFLLGRLRSTKGPGLIFLPPVLARMQKVSLRVMAIDVPPQDVITRDNISIKVNAVLYMRVKSPDKAVVGVENYLYATSQLAQTTLRSVLGETEMDELLANRDKINAILRQTIDTRTEEWGVEVSAVEVKDVDLPPEMKRAMARMAQEIVESQGGTDGFVLIGIRTRGVPLARRLAGELLSRENVRVPVGLLDITLYRDDLRENLNQPILRGTDIPFDRLKIEPWALRCVACETLRERGQRA